MAQARKRSKAKRTSRNPREDHSAARLLEYIQSMPPDHELADRVEEVVKERQRIKLRHFRITRPRMVEMKFEIPVRIRRDFLRKARAVYGDSQLAIDFAAQTALTKWVEEHNSERRTVSGAVSARGKYKGLVKVNMDQFEEDQERFVRTDKR